jgi:hypothetical protein
VASPTSRARLRRTQILDGAERETRACIRGWRDGVYQGEATLDNQNVRPKDAVIVPYGHVWRAGANEATMFVVTDDVLINGQKLAAGSYSLHTVPAKDEWTIIFNGTANQWGSFTYDAAKDTLRVKAKPEWVADNQEWLAYSFDPVTDNSAQVNIRWEKIRIPFTISIADVNATTLAHLRTQVGAAKMQQMAGNIDSIPMFTEQQELPASGVRNLNDEPSIRPQQLARRV